MFHVKQSIKIFIIMLITFQLYAQENTNTSKFKQLGTDLPTPNNIRNAAGAPGAEYWQQQADYKMKITLNENDKKIVGHEIITYTNNSPDDLAYLWLQLDQNVRAHNTDSKAAQTNKIGKQMSQGGLARLEHDFDGGFKLTSVKDKHKKDLRYTVNKTMMRIDLEEPLKSGKSFTFSIAYWYNINDRMKIGGRSGYENFAEEDNAIYTIAQFFPRMCAYNDVDGWQNKQFLGRGEFTLVFGDYEVDLTVPSDHIVAATGILQNENEVLTAQQRERWSRAQKEYKQPVMIVTEQEAMDNEKEHASGTKTWSFKAENVRDFAFASSRKFMWDAMMVKTPEGKEVIAASMYPKEANPLWGKYSTKTVAHTIKWFSHYTVDYPYPIAWSINAAAIGMEYPMICFNYGRCEEDGTYSERVKYGVISVIIHEVGHNFFPMIVNSDERQWTWMDEGLCSFVQYLTEQQFERNYPSRGGQAYKIVDYMKGDKSGIVPIMTNSESIKQFGNNAYSKPATALNILRESVMGRELFDMALKTYSTNWAFKQPMPADFFRTMEDASGVDLDWFWRGWFYTTDHVDIALEDVKEYIMDDGNPVLKEKKGEAAKTIEQTYITNIRNKEEIDKTYDEIDTLLVDFYTTYDKYNVTDKEKEAYQAEQKEEDSTDDNEYYYEMKFKNVGGLVMPVILKLVYEDGTEEDVRIPAEIWRFDTERITKVIPTSKRVKQIILDPYLETADTETSNNFYPPKPKEPSQFELFKNNNQQRKRQNPMQRAGVNNRS